MSMCPQRIRKLAAIDEAVANQKDKDPKKANSTSTSTTSAVRKYAVELDPKLYSIEDCLRFGMERHSYGYFGYLL